MSQSIEQRIAEIERELSGLRRQKLAELQQAVAALESSLDVTGGIPPAPSRRGRPPGPASTSAPIKSGTGKAGGKRGKHLSDDEAVALLRKVVQAAGREGIAAQPASASSGVSYPRAIKLMDANFTKTGNGRGTRYSL